MVFMCKFMHLAHIANKTRVDHDNILGIIISMLRVNVMIKKGFLPIGLYIKHTTSDPKLKKSKYRGTIRCDNWLAFLYWAKHIMKKGEACDIIRGELNQS
jgi:hypothetical protein